MAEKRAPLPSDADVAGPIDPRGTDPGGPDRHGQDGPRRDPDARAQAAPRPRLGGWLLGLIGAPLTLGAFALVAPFAPVDPTASEAAALIAYAVGYACVALLALGVAALTPGRSRGALAVAGLAAVALACMAFAGAVAGVYAASAVLLALLAIGTALGAAIGSRIVHVGHLSVVALVSSLADVASVVSPGGPSHEIALSPELLSLLALSWPMIGTTRIEPLLGVGDVVFVALYLSAARRHALPRARTVIALALGLAATASVVALAAVPVPALPFLGAAFLVAHPSARLPPRAERRKALVALFVLVVLAGALVLSRASG